MKRFALAAVGTVFLVLAADAPGALCGKCKGRMYIMSIGKCTKCQGHTSSGAFKLCKKCSGKLGQCENCLAGEGNPYPIRSLRDDEFHYIANLKHTEPYHEKHLQNETLAKRYDLQWWQATTDAAAAGDKRAKMLMDKFHNRPAEELYRVDKDPCEMNNLAADPKYAEVKQRLKTELARWMAEQNDPGAAMDVPLPQRPKRKPTKKEA